MQDRCSPDDVEIRQLARDDACNLRHGRAVVLRSLRSDDARTAAIAARQAAARSVAAAGAAFLAAAGNEPIGTLHLYRGVQRVLAKNRVLPDPRMLQVVRSVLS